MSDGNNDPQGQPRKVTQTMQQMRQLPTQITQALDREPVQIAQQMRQQATQVAQPLLPDKPEGRRA